LRKWFAAAWLIGQDKRGVSALFLARELALRYDTAQLVHGAQINGALPALTGYRNSVMD